MSCPNVDLVRSIYTAQQGGDFSSAGWAHPEIEYVIVDGPAPGAWTGVDGLAQAWRSVIEVWEGLRVEVDGYRELDGGRVLALTRFSAGRGKASGIDIGSTHARSAGLFHIRGGRVTKVVNYFDRDRALADLGLAPEADAVDSD
jgi:ketosteroid isomerase-like protein